MHYIGFRLNVTISLWPSPREVRPPSPSRSKDPTSLCTAVTLKRRTHCTRTSRVQVSTHSRNSTDPKSPWRNGPWSRSSSPFSTFLDFIYGLSLMNDWVLPEILFYFGSDWFTCIQYSLLLCDTKKVQTKHSSLE